MRAEAGEREPAVGERQRVIGQLRENRALEQIEQFILTLDAVLPNERQNFLMRARRYGIKGDMMEKFFPSAAVPWAPSVTSEFARMLAQRMGSDYLILSLPAAQEDCPPWPGRWAERSGPPPRGICEAFAVRLHDGAYARLMLLPPRPIPTIAARCVRP